MPHLPAASLQMKLGKEKGALVMHQQWSCSTVERKKKKKNCIRTAPTVSALMKLKKEKHRIANEPAASPLVRLEKNNVQLLMQLQLTCRWREKKKKTGWFLMHHQLIQWWSWKTNFYKDNSCNRTFSRGVVKKIERDKHSWCTYPNCNRLKLKKKTIMCHVPVASLQVKSKEKKGEHR
jgi:hypothetical protein